MFQELISFFCSHYSTKPFSELQVIGIVDENFDDTDLAKFACFKSTTFVTNRWDIFSALKEKNAVCYYGDFDFSQLSERYDACFYRVSKERAVCHHIFNNAIHFLKNDGILCVGGRKSEGAKGYHKKLTALFSESTGVKKNGDFYAYGLINNREPQEISRLDDNNYTELRELEINGFTFTTTPGQYGWNKIDAGSKFLMDTIIASNAMNEKNEQSILDIGCGYGYLSMRLLNEPTLQNLLSRLVATDNNAAAIRSCKSNLAHHAQKLSIEVVASDCADSINEQFDSVLCNPPFHQGFENSRTLTHRFLKSAATHLKPSGRAFFVVNSFIPLEHLALQYFIYCQVLSNNKQFKLLEARHS